MIYFITQWRRIHLTNVDFYLKYYSLSSYLFKFNNNIFERMDVVNITSRRLWYLTLLSTSPVEGSDISLCYQHHQQKAVISHFVINITSRRQWYLTLLSTSPAEGCDISLCYQHHQQKAVISHSVINITSRRRDISLCYQHHQQKAVITQHLELLSRWHHAAVRIIVSMASRST